MIKIKTLLTLAAISFIGLFSFSLYKKNIENGQKQSSYNEDAPGADYFTNTEFITHEGKEVSFFDDLIKNKIVLINFIYTTCGSSCPLETARLKKVYKLLSNRMGKDIFFYSISIDPEVDTPESLNSYRKRFGVGDGWFFLTGKKEEISEIQRKFGMYNGELNKSNYDNHTLSVMIGNQSTGKWIKRAHLEDPTILANLLENLLEKKEKTVLLKSYDNAPTRLKGLSRGENLFYSRCVDCHSIGNGPGIGPDLYNVVKNRDPKWLSRWLKEPDKMLEEKDQLAISLYEQYNRVPMPNLRLSDVDIAALIEFLDEESKNLK